MFASVLPAATELENQTRACIAARAPKDDASNAQRQSLYIVCRGQHGCSLRGRRAEGVMYLLEQCGLARYAPAFGNDDVDDSCLGTLTPEDLVDLGLPSWGLAWYI